MKEKKYNGVVVPMVTPVRENGDIDVDAVGRIVESFVSGGVSPLLMGTTGEGNSVSPESGLELVKATVDTAKGRIKVYAGLTGNVVRDQYRQAARYTEAGADVIVATLPSYYALTAGQMYLYYKNLADNIEGPLMMYNISSTTHMSIPVDVVERLSHHPNIVGLKDSERDLDRMAKIIAFSKERDDFSYFCGWAAKSEYSLSLGGDGIVPSTANFVPGMFRELYDAACTGNDERAKNLQEKTNGIAKIYQEGRILGETLTALKVMMGTRGLCDPYMLPPLTRLSADEENAIADKASRINNK